MIDWLWLPPAAHVVSGVAVLALTLLALVVSTVLAWRRRPLPAWGQAALVLAQVGLIVQALLGIKLLDQGLGPKQLYIHYLGGLGPLLFFLIFYWLPEDVRRARLTPVTVTASAFLFAVMAFGIGASFVAGGV